MTIKITKKELINFKETIPEYRRNEVFQFITKRYDVVKAQLVIQKENLDVTKLNKETIESYVKELGINYPVGSNKVSLFAYCDEEFITNGVIDLGRPLIFLEISLNQGRGRKKSKGYILIDGSHRLRKAWLHEIDELPAYFLDNSYEKLLEIR